MNELRRNILVSSQIGEGVIEPVIDIDNYLTIVALGDGLTAALSGNTVEYCVDGDGNWKTLASNANSVSINKGQTLSFKGNLTPASSKGVGRFKISKSCDLTGNCMSLLFGDNAADNNSLSGKDYSFYQLFYNCSTIKNVSSNFLPATTLADSCYSSMFRGCTSLTTVPKLPATTLVGSCYGSMFQGCTSLTTVPKLPATTLASNCYSYMFQGCTSLTTAPQLPAKTLKSQCYQYMFSGCSSLTTALELPATTLASNCYESMFSSCSSLTTAPSILPATTLANFCYFYMFKGCTSLTTVPELPATTLKGKCYYSMFQGCTSLTTAPELPATTLADSCYTYMFQGCTSLTTAPELPATTLVDDCYNSLFRGCTSLTIAPALPATTLKGSCYSYMFYGCTSLTTAPELPATTLAQNCYFSMFYGCSKLNYIKMLATNISTSYCLYQWVSGVASTGTFVKNVSMTSLPTGTSGIPSGWTVVDDWTPQTCINLAIIADNVNIGNQSTTTVHYTALCQGVDGYGVVSQKTLTGDAEVEIGQNKTTSTVQKTVSFTYLDKTATTTITQGPWVDGSYTVNLNSQWQKSSTISNPNSSVYDGVYESYSNKGTNNSGASMYIDINGYTNFKLYIRSYAEFSYDYVMVSQLDKTLTYSSSYSDTTLVKAHTRGNQKSGTTINDYTLVEFTNIDRGAHTIQIIYRKDSSQNSNDDRGYVIIPREQ